MLISILGSEWTILYVDYETDRYLKNNELDGYACPILKQIVVAYSATVPNRSDCSEKEHRISEKETLRHEIVHAFLFESGLADCSIILNSPWAKNEEMVDWIAHQGPKIYKAWQDADAL